MVRATLYIKAYAWYRNLLAHIVFGKLKRFRDKSYMTIKSLIKSRIGFNIGFGSVRVSSFNFYFSVSVGIWQYALTAVVLFITLSDMN